MPTPSPSWDAMIEHFIACHPHDAARVLETHAAIDVAQLLTKLEPEAAKGALAALLPDHAAQVLAILDDDVAASLLAILDLDVVARLLRRLDEEPRARLLALARPADARHLDAQLHYPEGVAGSLMDPRVVPLTEDLDVHQGRQHLERATSRGLYYVYIVNDDQELVGVLTLKELLLAPLDVTLASLMRREPFSLRVIDDTATILAHPGWRVVHALPVVDEADKLVGVVRYPMLRELERRSKTGDKRLPMTDGMELSELYWNVTTNLLDVVLGKGGGDGQR